MTPQYKETTSTRGFKTQHYVGGDWLGRRCEHTDEYLADADWTQLDRPPWDVQQRRCRKKIELADAQPDAQEHSKCLAKLRSEHPKAAQHHLHGKDMQHQHCHGWRSTPAWNISDDCEGIHRKNAHNKMSIGSTATSRTSARCGSAMELELPSKTAQKKQWR